MAIENRVERIRKLLDKIRRYNQLVVEDSLELTTLSDLKGNVKDLCDQIKDEADQIKAEADQWA